MHPLPPPRGTAESARDTQPSADRPSASTIPKTTAPERHSNSLSVPPVGSDGRKRRKHRGGKKKRNRRQSFAAPSEDLTLAALTEGPEDPLLEVPSNTSAGRNLKPFYRRRQSGNLSETSLDSDALLDHRHQPPMIPRRESRLAQTIFGSHQSGKSPTIPPMNEQAGGSYARRGQGRYNAHVSSGEDSDDGQNVNDRTPLIATRKGPTDRIGGYGVNRSSVNLSRLRKDSTSTASSRKKRKSLIRERSFPNFDQDYDINNPPSVPGSPSFQYNGLDDVMVSGGDFGLNRSPNSRRNLCDFGPEDAIIDIDGKTAHSDRGANSAPPSPRMDTDGINRRGTIAHPAEGDVCFPAGISEMADEDYIQRTQSGQLTGGSRRRNRRREWPELWVLDEWSCEEKEQRSEGNRAKKISEPVMIEGRLRPSKGGWHRTEEDAPYRYTYFNDEFESTIHAQTISELVQPGGSFRELFIPDPPELEDDSSDGEEVMFDDLQEKVPEQGLTSPRLSEIQNQEGRLNSMRSEGRPGSKENSGRVSGQGTPTKDAPTTPKAKRYGPRPTFWLDVMCPTDQEMRVLCKTFGIHALTSEDIMMQEAREKVELFRHYYFLNYRTFEQDVNSDDHMQPLNVYMCVFRHGVLSFHFSQIPHPANVRRRIRQLSDYLILSADWISYAIIDDITDAYQPLIQSIESDVDSIDEQILKLLSTTDELKSETKSLNEKHSDSGSVKDKQEKSSGLDILLGVGKCRKQVMLLYRLLGNKADVIKGFAKRCNEHWEVAPKSEIGLYLGDIQDHILTMTSSLGHYETLLSRAHSNYLAQINIRMNERSEKSADILGKLTVVGTIVLPMNIICGMWGMNVRVPGQEVDNLAWFWCIAAGLVVFAVSCFYWCKRMYGII